MALFHPGLAEWYTPLGGMFFWLKLPGIEDTHDLIMKEARAKEVLFVPGSAFSADEQVPSQYVRACYSLGTDEEIFEVSWSQRNDACSW